MYDNHFSDTYLQEKKDECRPYDTVSSTYQLMMIFNLLLELLTHTDSLLQCPLCKKDIQDPRILCSNGHTFCHNCLKVIPVFSSFLSSSMIF